MGRDWTEDVVIRFSRDRSVPRHWRVEAVYRGRAIDSAWVKTKIEGGEWFVRQGYGMPLQTQRPVVR